ncbi:MAG: glucuronate isomerase [bacterium]
MRLDENRFFDPDPTIRGIARELYDSVKDLPIVSPHGHVDPSIFADNQPFRDPVELIIIPDHYVFRMLYSQGISMESLGLSTLDGTPVETDRRKIWKIFSEHYFLFAGTPTGAWLDHELTEVFGVEEKPNADNALDVYDKIREKLKTPEYQPQAMFDRFNIEVLTTTDGAADTLEHHKKIRDSDWSGKIIPCFRPDATIDFSDPRWKESIEALGAESGIEITTYKKYIMALEQRREFFKSIGAVSTDQGVATPYTHELTLSEAGSIFGKALQGNATSDDAALFIAHMLMEMARMSIEDGLVMQIHPGSFRNHNRLIFDKFGRDMGSDIPVRTEYTYNLHELLNKYGNDSRLTLILFTLDESTYSRELAPLAGHYPALRLGPPWWFHDSIEGMGRYRRTVTETAGIYNTVGFNDDTRAFPSIPARHDLSRRVDSNFLAGLVARHIIDMDDARAMGRALACDLARKSYKLG